jgi:photosystem II stability/assembly factor-like uncharacterized protein
MAVTTDGGGTWTTQSLPPGTAGLSGVACPSRSTCYAVGGVNHAVEATTDGGATWTSQPLPANSKVQLNAVACPATSTCYVVGNAFTGNFGGRVYATSDGGATWVNKALPANQVGALEAVTCPTVSTCYVAGFSGGGVLAVTSDGGTTWAVTNESGVATSSSTCYGTTQGGRFAPWYTGAVLATTDTGGTWALQAVPAGIPDLSGIACSATCYAVGSGENQVGAVILSLSTAGARPPAR